MLVGIDKILQERNGCIFNYFAQSLLHHERDRSDPGDKSKYFSSKNALLLVMSLGEGLTVVFLPKPLLRLFLPMSAVSHRA